MSGSSRGESGGWCLPNPLNAPLKFIYRAGNPFKIIFNLCMCVCGREH